MEITIIGTGNLARLALAQALRHHESAGLGVCPHG